MCEPSLPFPFQKVFFNSEKCWGWVQKWKPPVPFSTTTDIFLNLGQYLAYPPWSPLGWIYCWSDIAGASSCQHRLEITLCLNYVTLIAWNDSKAVQVGYIIGLYQNDNKFIPVWHLEAMPTNGGFSKKNRQQIFNDIIFQKTNFFSYYSW